MKIGDGGLALIKSFEGLRLRAYRDPVGVLTIGYGHTAAAGGAAFHEETTITEPEAERILRSDLAKFEDAVSSLTTRSPNQNQFDAMVSLCFNIGPAAFAKSSVLRLFNEGQDEAAADAFLLWNKAGGKVLDGLTRRRKAEAALFRREAPVIMTKETIMEPTTEVPVRSAWASKINWTQAIASLLAVAIAFGLPVSDEDRLKILAAVPIVQGLVTWVLRTWFTNSVTPAVAAKN